MKHEERAQTVGRGRKAARRTAVACAVAALGLALGPVAAQADTTMSATGSGWGTDWAMAMTNAQNDAYGNLWEDAHALGLTCTNVTYVDNLSYIVPGGGGYVFDSTATGDCS